MYHYMNLEMIITMQWLCVAILTYVVMLLSVMPTCYVALAKNFQLIDLLKYVHSYKLKACQLF